MQPVSTPDADVPPPPRHSSSGYVPNYLAPAILATLFCCLPFGIVSIVYAAQVNGQLAAGDGAGAMRSSNNAKTWMWVAVACGVFIWFLWLLYFLFVVSFSV